MKKLIKILSYKKVKTDKVYDIVKCVDVAWADIDDIDYQAVVSDGKYKDKYLNKLGYDYKKHDFTYDIINLDITLEEAHEFYNDSFYYIEPIKGNSVGLRECLDERIITEFDHFVNPSIEAQLSGLIMNMKKNNENHFTIPAALTAQFLGQTDSLQEQDTNKYKSVLDYDIKSKFHELQQIIIGQDEQLKVLLANLIKNISLSYSDLEDQKVKNLKSRILLIGGTGTGKTLMVENIASMLEVPYVIEDAKRYTSNGYVGEDVENMLVNLYRAAGEDLEKFTHGVVFIDEIDKLCNIKDERSHVATTDVQEALLKLLDGGKIIKTINQGLNSKTITLDTTRITFVLAGAFEDLSNSPDFDSDITLEKAGMIPELVARLNTKIITNKPTKEQLKEALVDSKYGYLKLLEEYLGIYNIPVEVTSEFIDKIVEEAYSLNRGYRALNKAINKVVNNYLFDIYAGDIHKLTLVNE